MEYVFPVVISYDQTEQVYNAEFPDLSGCFTWGTTVYEVLENARDALGLFLVTAEDEKQNIPEPTSVKCIQLKHGEFTNLVWINTDKARQDVYYVTSQAAYA